MFLTFSQHTFIHKSILKYQNQIELFIHGSHPEKNMHYNQKKKKRIVAIETLNTIVYMAQIELRWPTFGPSGTSKGTKYDHL